jgi:hypothetical protein
VWIEHKIVCAAEARRYVDGDVDHRRDLDAGH